MTMKLIGVGYGRTGTLSLKLAYEMLGFGRCYHMREVIENQDHIDKWVRAAKGKPDWDDIFRGYTATVDWPACTFWRELIAYYPKAKVLLSQRPSEKWWASTQATIFSPALRQMIDDDSFVKGFAPMFEAVVASCFGGRINDREHMIATYERHNAEVIRTVPKERLLVYDVAEGWGPLCRFLGVPAPDAPFPRANSTAEFATRRDLAGPSP